jgi:hypothetical protein
MDPTKHNYFRKQMELLAAGVIRPGQVALVDIYHDDWCQIFTGGYCNCDPEIQLPIRPLMLTPERN